MRALLDSSAWLAHLFDEPGGVEVTRILSDDNNEVFLSALSVPEVFSRLKALGKQDSWAEIWETYQPMVRDVFSVDLAVAQKAVKLKKAASERIPTIDSLIAATASLHGLTLVHRDPHMAFIPAALLDSLRLPDKRASG